MRKAIDIQAKMKKRKIILIILAVCLGLAILGAVAVFSIDAYVKHVGKADILSPDEASALEDVDCIIVLGCQVKADGSLSKMLRDRLITGVELYKRGAAPKLLMSGDHGREDYDEVAAMKSYAIENGVPSEDVFMDHAGFSTYETVWRAKEIFGADKVIIVTQEYHLYRALYIADKLGIEAYGVAADLNTYGGQYIRDFREILARNKDFAMCIFKPEATGGETIPISGNGDMTND